MLVTYSRGPRLYTRVIHVNDNGGMTCSGEELIYGQEQRGEINGVCVFFTDGGLCVALGGITGLCVCLQPMTAR